MSAPSNAKGKNKNGRWRRAYDGDVKDDRLIDLEPELFKTWYFLLCLASGNDGWGSLPPTKVCARALGFSDKKMEKFVNFLIETGLIHRDENGILSPDKWDELQFLSDGSSLRTKGWRKRKEDKEKARLMAEQHRAETAAKDAKVNVTVNVHQADPVNVHMVQGERHGERRGEQLGDAQVNNAPLYLLSESGSVSPSRVVESISVGEGAAKPARLIRPPAPPPRPIIPKAPSRQSIVVLPPDDVAWPDEHFPLSAI
jgi:hypothetical protein